MPLTLTWQDVAVRLGLTVLAGALIGINRGERGRPAGLRTTLLVCLAASIAMIQTNLLIITRGKPVDSFVVMDVMRLPLGILSGMGFIGAGAIIRRGNLIHGVTTASTLWFVTVIGLCFGGGQIGIGLAGLAIGLIVLWVLKRVELWMPTNRQASLTIIVNRGGPGEDAIRSEILAAGLHLASWQVGYMNPSGRRKLQCEVVWRGAAEEVGQPAFVRTFAGYPDVLRLEWKESPRT